MILDDSILCSLPDCDSISALNIFCEDSQKEEIENFFKETFLKEWNNLLNQVEEKYGNCLEKEKNITPILGFTNSDKGVLVSFNSFLISYRNGNIFAADVNGDIALKKTLNELLEKYPNISYEGYIGYFYSTPNGGDVIQYTVSSEGKINKNKIFPFIGETLAAYLDDEFWENFENELYDYEDEEEFSEVLNSLVAYEKWLGKETIDKFLEIVDEIDEDIRESLEDKLDED